MKVNLTHEHRCKTPNQKIVNPNQWDILTTTITKYIHIHIKVEFILGTKIALHPPKKSYDTRDKKEIMIKFTNFSFSKTGTKWNFLILKRIAIKKNYRKHLVGKC